jgi:hypothetical protein
MFGKFKKLFIFISDLFPRDRQPPGHRLRSGFLRIRRIGNAGNLGPCVRAQRHDLVGENARGRCYEGSFNLVGFENTINIILKQNPNFEVL